MAVVKAQRFMCNPDGLEKIYRNKLSITVIWSRESEPELRRSSKQYYQIISDRSKPTDYRTSLSLAFLQK